MAARCYLLVNGSQVLCLFLGHLLVEAGAHLHDGAAAAALQQVDVSTLLGSGQGGARGVSREWTGGGQEVDRGGQGVERRWTGGEQGWTGGEEGG